MPHLVLGHSRLVGVQDDLRFHLGGVRRSFLLSAAVRFGGRGFWFCSYALTWFFSLLWPKKVLGLSFTQSYFPEMMIEWTQGFILGIRYVKVPFHLLSSITLFPPVC